MECEVLKEGMSSSCSETETSQGRQDGEWLGVVELESQRQPIQTTQGLVGQSKNSGFYLKYMLKPV